MKTTAWILASLLACTSACEADDHSAHPADASDASTSDTSSGDAKGDTSSAGSSYQPFQQANLANQLLRVAAWQSINTLRKSPDFKAEHFGESCGNWSTSATAASDPSKFASLYVETANLSAKVAGRKDIHPYANPVELGKQLDAAICNAIEAGGKAGATARDSAGSIDWHAQIVDKSLQHFFYASLFNYLLDGSRKGYDEGIGYYGMSLDGAEAVGLAGTVASRDANCGTTYASQIWQLLRSGRGKLDAALTAEGKTGNEDKLSKLTPDLQALASEVDGKILEVLALSLGREMIGIQKGDKPSIKLIEGRMFASMLLPYVADWDKQKATQHAAALQSLSQDDPAKAETAKVLAAIQAVWGLDVATLCK